MPGLALLLLSGPSVWSGEYVPFTYVDPREAEDPALREFLPGLHAKLPDATRVSEIALPEARLRFFAEIAERLEAATTAGPVAASPDRSAGSCVEHERIQPPVIASSGDCAPLQAQAAAAFADFRGDCVHATRAERFVEEQSETVVNPKKMSVNPEEVKTLEGLIRLAGKPLSQITFPGNLFTTEMKTRLRTIIAKIRHPELVGRIDRRNTLYAELALGVQQRHSCVTEPEALEKGLAALQGELRTARAELDRLDREGRRQAEADRQALLKRGRVRGELPYPSLSDEERQSLSMVLGGVYWRMRGGGLMNLSSTQKARYYFNLMPMTAIGELSGGATGRAAGAAIFAKIFEGWGKYQGQNRLSDLAQMTRRGQSQVSWAALGLRKLGYDSGELEAGGLQMGPCYFYARARLRELRVGDPPPAPYNFAFLEWYTAWGELCSGSSISLGLSRSLLNGKKR